MRHKTVEKRKGGWPKGKKRGPRKSESEKCILPTSATEAIIWDKNSAVRKAFDIVQEGHWQAKYEALRSLLIDIFRINRDLTLSWEAK